MTSMTWRAGYPEEYRALEEQHEKIGKLLAELKASSHDGSDKNTRALALNLLRELRHHSRSEEKAMEERKFPERAFHKKHHEIIADGVELIIKLLGGQGVSGFGERIARHIGERLSEELLVDQLFIEYLKKTGRTLRVVR
jgi:hemerythrin